MNLDDLIKAVEAGTLPEAVFHGCSGVRGHWAYDTGLDAEQRKWVYLAYNGSLDAAKDLHKAMVPQWRVGVLHEEWNGKWSCRIYGLRPEDGAYAEASDAARAWLLAILKALQAEGRG